MPSKWIKNKPKILLFLASFLFLTLFIFSFLDIPWVTTFHSYTFGVLFGFSSSFFYFFIFFICWKPFLPVFYNKLTYFKPSKGKILILVFALVLLIIASIELHHGRVYPVLSKQNWESNFNNWWMRFKNFDVNKNGWLLPSKYHFGLLFVFIYTFLSWLTTIYTIFAISIILILFIVYLVFFPDKLIPRFFKGEFWTIIFIKIGKIFRKNPKENKINYDLEETEEEYDSKSSDFGSETFNEEFSGSIDDMIYEGAGISEDPLKASKDFQKAYDRSLKKKEKDQEEELPFDDPF